MNYYWDEIYGVNNSAMGRYLTKKELAFIEDFLGTQKNIRNILELGCGSGRLSIPVYKKYKFQITGLDADPVALKLLNERENKIKTIKADLSKPLKFKDNSFDFILSIEFLDYLTDLDAFFKECGRVLAPGGYMIFTSGNAASYKRRLQQLFGRHKGRYLFTTGDIKNSLRRAGFEIKKLQGYNWLPVRRESQSPLIPVLAHLEKNLGLENLPSASPWIICLARLQTPKSVANGGQAQNEKK